MLNQQTKKKWIKAAGVALVIMLGAAGTSWAQKEERLIRVSDIYDHRGNMGTMDELCEIAASTLVDGGSYTGSWHWETSNQVFCGIANNYYFKYVPTVPQCPDKLIFNKEELGCYELRDVTQECQTARENLLQQGTPLPEYCNITPPNNPLCEQVRARPRPPGNWQPSGVVACKGNDRYVCAWTDQYTLTNPIARLISFRCTQLHEQRHKDAESKYSSYCSDPVRGGIIATPSPQGFVNEVSAHVIGKRCLIESRQYCRGDETCLREIDDRINANQRQIEGYSDHYNKYCMRPQYMNTRECNRNNWPELNGQ